MIVIGGEGYVNWEIKSLRKPSKQETDSFHLSQIIGEPTELAIPLAHIDLICRNMSRMTIIYRDTPNPIP